MWIPCDKRMAVLFGTFIIRLCPLRRAEIWCMSTQVLASTKSRDRVSKVDGTHDKCLVCSDGTFLSKILGIACKSSPLLAN